MQKKRLHIVALIGFTLIFVVAILVAVSVKDGDISMPLLIGVAGCCLLLVMLLYKAASNRLPEEESSQIINLSCTVDSENNALLLSEEDLIQLNRLMKKTTKHGQVICQVQLGENQYELGVIRKETIDLKVVAPSHDTNSKIETQLSLVHDSLTGLLSKASMMSLIGKELEHRRATGKGLCGLFVLDINNYRAVNTRYGYSMGDRVLSEVGCRLNQLSSPGVLVGRIESNNFVAFIKDLKSYHEMDDYAQRIQAVFETPINLGAGDIHITASIGAAVTPAATTSLDRIMSYAFTAMAQAKAQGQGNNYQLFNSSMKRKADRRGQIIRILENHEKTGSLRVYYQPQYISKNGNIHGLEALLRVIDSELGMVPPKEFIPIAEETGLIIDIGYWCIRECCRAIKRFKKAGLLFTAISINVSLVQLTALDFVDRVKEIVLEEGVDPSMLAFEITESMLMCSMEHGENLLRQLKDFGVRVVLDDFGSGYSSLNYIRSLSIDTLKIDKSFIDGICTDGKSKYIIELILNLAEKIDLEVVAEGVETEEQLKVLKSFACPIIQGFYFSKPIPEQDVVHLLCNGA